MKLLLAILTFTATFALSSCNTPPAPANPTFATWDALCNNCHRTLATHWPGKEGDDAEYHLYCTETITLVPKTVWVPKKAEAPKK